MARWRRTLRLKDLLTEDGSNAAVRQAAQGVYARLEPFRSRCYPKDDELQMLCNEFQEMGEDPDADEDDFNLALDGLYEWGDTLHRLWID